MVRYCRAGGEAMSIAIRIARAKTGRETVAFCGYHGWSDWYLAANLNSRQELDGHLLPGLNPAGVPRGLAGTALPFRYNQLDELREIVRRTPDSLAAIVTEPLRYQEPAPGYFDEMRKLADEAGAVLIVDEITAGFRLTTGGAHLLYGVEPDLAVFAKGMSNGYAMAAIIGRASIMQAAQDTFISSTYWTERVGPTAALATIAKHRELDLPSHLAWVGERLRTGWQDAAKSAGLSLKISGMKPAPGFSIDHPEGQAAATYFTQAMLARGFLAGRAVYATLAHDEPLLEKYFRAVGPVFHEIAAALEKGHIQRLLQGPVAHAGFARIA
jgi:glutamate-1-semialdehyde aminotransferase